NPYRCQPIGIVVAKRLAPEQVVHYVGRLYQQYQHLSLLIAQSRQVRRQGKIRVDIGPGLDRRGPLRFTWSCIVLTGGCIGPTASCKKSQCGDGEDRKSTRLNSSHVKISYAVFCLKKKK